MRIEGNSCERFRDGLAAGHVAGRSRELMYALGFVAGFLWGALFEARRNEPGFRRPAHVA